MRSEKTEILLKHELEKNKVFFEVFRDVFGGMMFRRQFVGFIPNHDKYLKTWSELGIVFSSDIGSNKLYRMCRCKPLQMLSPRQITGALILRNMLRYYYYISRGFTTPEQVLEFSKKGSDRVMRTSVPMELLQNYNTSFEAKGVHIPNFVSEEKANIIRRLSFRNIAITHTTYKSGTITPHLVIYQILRTTPSKLAELITLAHRLCSDLFYADGIKIDPDVTICRFECNDDMPQVITALQKRREFLCLSSETLEERLHTISVVRKLGYINPALIL
ncbi:MAG: hypothetical protein RSA27_07375 [Oscillospiraceae bacterium]